MTKTEFITNLQKELEISKKEAERIHDCFTATMRNALISGKTVPLATIGFLRLTLRKPRKSVNPRTKETIYVPEKLGLKFTPNEKLVKEIRETLPIDVLK